MINNPKLLQAIEDVFNERFEQEMQEFKSPPPFVFSEKHKKKMAKLIKRQRKPYFKLICTAGRRAACIVVIVLVVFASSLTVKAIREAIYDFIMRIFSDHTVVTVESGTAEGYPETIEEEYYISALPEGFELVDDVHNDMMIERIYFYTDKYIFFTQYTKNCYKELYDNSKVEYDIYENGIYNFLTIESEYETSYIWDNGDYIFVVTSNLDKEAVAKLFESTKIDFKSY